MKVRIKRWQAVSTWRWDLRDEEDVCGICRGAFEGTCGSNNAASAPGTGADAAPDGPMVPCKMPGDECPLIVGTRCNHYFHMHCLHRWHGAELSPVKTCPMCRANWYEGDTIQDESAMGNTEMDDMNGSMEE